MRAKPALPGQPAKEGNFIAITQMVTPAPMAAQANPRRKGWRASRRSILPVMEATKPGGVERGPRSGSGNLLAMAGARRLHPP